MYKSKLHEFCQSKRISMPEYTTRKEGFDHCPGFKAVVNVNGLSFTPKKLSRNSKEAQNQAAKLAFDHFTNNGSSSGTNALPPASSIIVQPRIPELSQNASFGQTTFMTKDDERFKDMAHLYKNRLQFYAQKSNLALPAYTFEREGPPHASRFKSKVTVGGQIYESPEYFNTVKEAENAAAKVAFLGLSPGGAEEDDTGFSKKLLQVFLQREYSCLPKYTTSQSGASHVPTFVSTVDINGETFRGDEAKTKKQAEANAAKVAYIAFKDRRQGLEAHSIKSNIKQLQHQPEPVTMSENNRGRQGLEAHSIKSNIKQLQHQPEPVTMSENNRGRQGLEAHSIKSNIKQLQHQPEPVTMSENNRVVPEKAAKSVHVMETPEVVEEKDTESSSLQNPLQAVSQSEKVDSSAVASSEEGQALTDSVEKVSINGPTASVPPGRRPRRKIVTRPFKPGMEIPPRAILRFCDEKYIAYEVPNED